MTQRWKRDAFFREELVVLLTFSLLSFFQLVGLSFVTTTSEHPVKSIIMDPALCCWNTEFCFMAECKTL